MPALARDCRGELQEQGGLADARIATANGRTGIGVELEVLSLRIELAWFDAVPVSPGRRIVFSLLADASARE